MNESSPKDKGNTLKDCLLKSFNYESIENYSNVELIKLIYKSFLSLEEILKVKTINEKKKGKKYININILIHNTL